MKNSIKAIAIGALTAGMVAVPALGAVAATTPVAQPEITVVYENSRWIPLGTSGADRTATIKDGTATIGGQFRSQTPIDKVELVSGGETLCTDTTVESSGGSSVFSCDVVVPKGDTVITAVAFHGTEHSASERNLRLTNTGTPTPPVTDPPPSTTIDAPTVSLTENFGPQLRASIHIDGKKIAGSHFIVLVQGEKQIVDASSGQADAIVESPQTGTTLVKVMQVSGNTSSLFGSLPVKFGDSTVPPAPPVSPVAPVDPNRPTDPGFTVTPPASETIDAPKVSLIQHFGLERRAAILIQGQKLDSSEFVVTFDGKQERIPASSGQTFTIVESKSSGPQTIRVQQATANATSATTLFQVDFR